MKVIFDFFLKNIFQHLDGYKAKIGSFAIILYGIIGIIANYWPNEHLPVVSVETAIALVAYGFKEYGQSAKSEKQLQELKIFNQLRTEEVCKLRELLEQQEKKALSSP